MENGCRADSSKGLIILGRQESKIGLGRTIVGNGSVSSSTWVTV